jgi:hypothetical protein
MAARLHTWTQISGWPLQAALKAGELRTICAHPYCDWSSRFSAAVDPGLRLWVIAQRMRCKGCGHRGAQFEIWGSAPDQPATAAPHRP